MAKKHRFTCDYGSTFSTQGGDKKLFFREGDVVELEPDVVDFIKRDSPESIVEHKPAKKKKPAAKKPAAKSGKPKGKKDKKPADVPPVEENPDSQEGADDDADEADEDGAPIEGDSADEDEETKSRQETGEGTKNRGFFGGIVDKATGK